MGLGLRRERDQQGQPKEAGPPGCLLIRDRHAFVNVINCQNEAIDLPQKGWQLQLAVAAGQGGRRAPMASGAGAPAC